jgi:uncharacterized membrane protein
LSTVGYFLLALVAGWCVFLMNVLSLHLAGTVIHDASHNSAHRNRTVNAMLGHGSALILGFSFPVFTRVHLQHHAHVNDPENDPDHFVSTGGPLWLIAARFFYHEVYFFKRRLWRNWELLEWFLGRLAVGLLVFTAWQFDFLGYIFQLLVFPSVGGGYRPGAVFRLPAPSSLRGARSLEKCQSVSQSHSELADHGTELSPGTPSLAIYSLVQVQAYLRSNAPLAGCKGFPSVLRAVANEGLF